MGFSSILPISWLWAIFQALKHIPPREDRKDCIYYFMSKLCLTIGMPLNTCSIFQSIYGTNFSKSSQKAFDTVLPYCLLHLATTCVCFIV